jgi:hypothetical protein
MTQVLGTQVALMKNLPSILPCLVLVLPVLDVAQASASIFQIFSGSNLDHMPLPPRYQHLLKAKNCNWESSAPLRISAIQKSNGKD